MTQCTVAVSVGKEVVKHLEQDGRTAANLYSPRQS